MILKPPKAKKTDVLNMFTDSFLYDRFKLLCLNRIKWNKLEEFNIKESYVEEKLFSEGFCIFFEDKDLGFLCLPGQGEGKPNVYNDYVKYRVTGNNYSKVIPANKCVVIENNKLRMPTEKAVLFFITKLYNLSRSSDVNTEQLKVQTLFSATDKNILTVKKIIDEIANNNWAIITDSTMALDDIVKAINTGVKCMLPELRDEYNAVLNEALTYFGINNSNTDKRERLITDEANANNQFIDSCSDMFLEARERACKEIKEKFGIDISVELRNKREEKVPEKEDKDNDFSNE